MLFKFFNVNSTKTDYLLLFLSKQILIYYKLKKTYKMKNYDNGSLLILYMIYSNSYKS